MSRLHWVKHDAKERAMIATRTPDALNRAKARGVSLAPSNRRNRSRMPASAMSGLGSIPEPRRIQVIEQAKPGTLLAGDVPQGIPHGLEGRRFRFANGGSSTGPSPTVCKKPATHSSRLRGCR
jgi:hypothetical protein